MADLSVKWSQFLLVENVNTFQHTEREYNVNHKMVGK